MHDVLWWWLYVDTSDIICLFVNNQYWYVSGVCVQFDILASHACNEYVNNTAYQADEDLWLATFNTSDLAFDSPDNNANNPIMVGIVYITDQNFTGGDDAGLNVWCVDKGIINYCVQIT